MSAIKAISISPTEFSSFIYVPVHPHVSYKFSACLPTMFNMNLERVADWLNYYSTEFQLDSAILYVLPAFSEEDFNSLMQFVTGDIDIVVLKQPEYLNNAKNFHYFGQYPVDHDCWMRSMGSEFVFFPDYDEFLTFSSPMSINDLFTPDIGSVTFGSQFYSTKYCLKNDFNIPITKRMPILEDPLPECKDDYFDPFNCLGQHGRRKYIARPSTIGHLDFHSCTIIDEHFWLVNVDTRVALLRRYRDYFKKDVDICTKSMSSSIDNIKVPVVDVKKQVKNQKTLYDSFSLSPRATPLPTPATGNQKSDFKKVCQRGYVDPASMINYKFFDIAMKYTYGVFYVRSLVNPGFIVPGFLEIFTWKMFECIDQIWHLQQSVPLPVAGEKVMLVP
ncbi:hypothetical protein GEMRC1_010697 [Eukaryota sp. GEM-RC1]